MIERPHGVTINGTHFYLYPVTLGKRLILSRLYASLDFDVEVMAASAELECLRLIKASRAAICRIIAFHTLANKREVFDNKLLSKREEIIGEVADEDLAALFLVLMNADKTAKIAKALGIDRENERYRKAARAVENKDSGTYHFGMASDYGRLLDFAAERYHWTLDYIMWGISYTNLQLMIADSSKTLYLDKDERRRARLSNDGVTINGDDRNAWEKIKQMNWN